MINALLYYIITQYTQGKGEQVVFDLIIICERK